jgi:hypothetical protein
LVAGPNSALARQAEAPPLPPAILRRRKSVTQCAHGCAGDFDPAPVEIRRRIWRGAR